MHVCALIASLFDPGVTPHLKGYVLACNASRLVAHRSHRVFFLYDALTEKDIRRGDLVCRAPPHNDDTSAAGAIRWSRLFAAKLAPSSPAPTPDAISSSEYRKPRAENDERRTPYDDLPIYLRVCAPYEEH